MKKGLLWTGFLFAVFLALISVETLPAYAGSKIRVAVMDFETRVPSHGWRVGRGASDMLTTALVKTKKFRIFERDKLASILKEQKLQMSGLVSQSTAVKIGKLIGVKYIITGAVTEYGHSRSGFRAGRYGSIGKKGYSASVDVRAVNVQTGEIVFADTGSGSKQSLSVKAFGFGGGESFDQKKASESMRMAIDEVAKKIYIDLD